MGSANRRLHEENIQLRATLREREAELADWKESVKTIMETSCRADEKHCACVPLLRAKVKESEENYEDMITHRLELESTVARLRGALDKYGNHLPACSEDRGKIESYKCDCGFSKESVPSPSDNSGEKPWTQEEIDSAKKRAAVKVANFAIDPPGFSELELLRELEIEVKEYLNLGFTNGRKIIGKLDALRKSVSPGEEGK